VANRSFMTFRVTLIATLLTAGPSYGAQERATGEVLQQFEQSIHEYKVLRHAVERQLPPLQVSPDPRAIDEAVHMRAAAIRLARATARVGDIFAPGIAELFRMRIGQALETRDDLKLDLLLPDTEEDEPPPPPIVNGRFSWSMAVATPACVLAALPPLSEELQYRFVARDLVLVDIDANLIVDVLPDVL
jgi:hypothetical protein